MPEMHVPYIVPGEGLPAHFQGFRSTVQGNLAADAWSNPHVLSCKGPRGQSLGCKRTVQATVPKVHVPCLC